MNPAESSAEPPPRVDAAHPPRRQGVTDHVTELFHEEIRSGRWPVGERIPVESALVTWTGAGRNAVREAVQSLVQSGLVRREQGRGTFVIARSQLAQTLSRRISRGARRDGLELRSALDSSAAALAALRRTPRDIAQLERLLAERAASWLPSGPGSAGVGFGAAEPQADVDRDLDRRIRTDLALHRAIVEATHNPLYLELYEGLTAVFEEVQRADVEGDTDPHAEHHARLVEAIVAGDAAAARREIEALIDPLIERA